MAASSPAEERPGYVFELGTSVVLAWTVLGTILFVLAGYGVGAAYVLTRHRVVLEGSSALAWLIAAAAVLPLHELIHAAVVVALGGRPRFGAGVKAGLPYLYVTAPGQRFPRDAFLMVGLAPLVVIDVAGLLVIGLQPAWTWVIPALVLNTSGAIGDLWICGLVVRFQRWSLVEDRRLGFAIWAPPGRSPSEIGSRAPRLRFVAPDWFVPWLVATVLLMPVVTVLLAVAARRWGSIRMGPLVMATVHRRFSGGGGQALELNLLLDAALAALLALPIAWGLTFAWRQLRRRFRRTSVL